MMSVKDYNAAMKRLAKVERQLENALDKLKAARSDHRPEDVTRWRVEAERLETEVEAALEAATDAHAAYWKGMAAEVEQTLPEAIKPFVRYRHCVRAAGGLATLEAGLTPQLLATANQEPPQDLGDLPVHRPHSETLERAGDEL